MNKNPLLLIILASLNLLSSCTLNGNYNKTFTDTSSSVQKDDFDNTFLIACIPEDFYINGEYYAVNHDIEIDDGGISNFFGYLINKEDLEKWKAYDKLENITYVIDETNSTYHYDLTGKLTNRFELFLTKKLNEIALKVEGYYKIYKNITLIEKML